MIKLTSPANGSCISLLNDDQNQFYKDEPLRAEKRDDPQYSWYVADTDKTHPVPVKLSWESNIKKTEYILL